MTFPLELELVNLPGKTELRSLSRFGLSVITVVFRDDVDICFARQVILEKVVQARARLPEHAEPLLGPVSTGLSEVYHYLVEGPGRTLMELRTLQDWVVRPLLRSARLSRGGYAGWLGKAVRHPRRSRPSHKPRAHAPTGDRRRDAK